MEMDAAEVQALVQAAVTEAVRALGAAGVVGGGSTSKGGNVHKHYTRLEKLENGDHWKEWHYQFGVATREFSEHNGALLGIIEAKEMDEVTTDDLELALTHGEAAHMRKTMGELFSVLTLLTKGEANQIVRSVEDLNGYAAWKGFTIGSIPGRRQASQQRGGK